MRNKLLLLLLAAIMLLGTVSVQGEGRQGERAAAAAAFDAEFYTLDATIADSRRQSGSDAWDIEFAIEAQALTDIDTGTDLTYTINKLANDRTGMEQVHSGTIVTQARMVQGEPLHTNLRISLVTPGQYELILQATSQLPADEALGGRRQLMFEMTGEAVEEDWSNKYIPSRVRAEISETPASRSYEAKDSRRVSVSGLSIGSTTPVDLDLGSYLHGNWKYYKFAYPEHLHLNIRHAKVEVKYWNLFDGKQRTLGTTYTNENGNWYMKYPENLPVLTWEVTVYAQSSFGNIMNPNDENRTWSSSSYYSGAMSGKYMGASVPDNTEVQEAFEIYDDMVDMRTLLLQSGKNPGSAKVYYDSIEYNHISYFSYKAVYLYAGTSGSSAPAHELGHQYMYNLYGGYPDIEDGCVGHSLTNTRTERCAWTEGWATFLAIMLRDGKYRRPEGRVFNMEHTTMFPEGDLAEARVIGALWDVYDAANDGLDQSSYPFRAIYEAMWSGGQKDTFRDWWERWKALGYGVDARSSLAQNTIYYD